MKQVWIVYHDSGPDNNILGVFDNEEDAYAYQELEAPFHEKGALVSPVSVPWRRLDNVSEIRLG